MGDTELEHVEAEARTILKGIKAKGLDRNSSCNLPVFRIPGCYPSTFVRKKTGPKPKPKP